MKRIIHLVMMHFFATYSLTVNAQSNKCATMLNLQKSIAKDPALKQRMIDNEKITQQWIASHTSNKKANAAITVIPTVVHVIWHDSIENVSDEQILSQIDVLNKDFRLLNSDTLDPQHPFRPFAADTEIEFCLAKQDPDGNPTNGITRTKTQIVNWNLDNGEGVKSTALGGKDNWEPTQYLNIYVVSIDSNLELAGIATFPEELETSPEQDGVIINYKTFGKIGLKGNFTLGRTTTHEVGHWLNLRHIWGDTLCGNDFVDDTPPAEGANSGNPTFPHRPNNLCGSDSNGEMYMNHMDYSNDSSLNMFTAGQAVRMHATLNGLRSGILTSIGCKLPTALNEINSLNAVAVYPNPNNGRFILSIKLVNNLLYKATLINMVGTSIKDFGIISNEISNFDLNDIATGVYYLRVSDSKGSSIVKKVFITK